MNDSGKISIILPCYCAERCVGGMIGDVKRQTYTNWELFVVSNGSKQEAQMKVIRQCAEGDERIHVMSIEQAGVSNARNEAMTLMTGDWLAFVDADDRLTDNHLELLAQGVAKDVDVVIGGFSVSYHSANRPYRVVNLEPNHGLDRYVLGIGDMVFGALWNKLFKADTLCLWNGKFNPSITSGEDKLFFFQYLQYTNKIQTIAQTGYVYTFDSSSSADVRYHPTFETTYKEITALHIELCRKVGYSDAELYELCIKSAWSDTYYSVLNLFKKDSPLSIVQQYRNVKRMVFDDKDVYGCLTVAIRQHNSRLLIKIFNRLVRLHSPLLMTVVYRFLFFCQHVLLWLRLR